MQQTQEIEKLELGDIPEFNQYDGKFPVFNPEYRDQEYLIYFEKLKTIIKNKQYTPRANELAELVAEKHPSNYNAWFIKRCCLQAGVTTLEAEMKFSREFMLENVKNFQGWEYRRHLLQLRKDPAGELDYVDLILSQQEKNYHVWSYRVWLTRHYGLYEEDKSRIEKWIALDHYNNSAWSYRHFLYSSTPLTPEQFSAEIAYAMGSIETYPDNEAAWNYLRGWFPSIRLRYFSKNQPFSQIQRRYQDHEELLSFCLLLLKTNQFLLQPYITLVNIYSQKAQTLEMCRNVNKSELNYQIQPQLLLQICDVLIDKQPQKVNYWMWVKANLFSS